MEIKQVTVITDRGDCFVTVGDSPRYLSVCFSHDLVKHADMELLSKVIAKALKMVVDE